MPRLSGKIILITGGGAGIGRATAIRCAEEDATVVLTDVNTAGGEETVRLAGQRAHFITQNTVSETDWVRVLADIKARFGALHGLVNNAGILGPFPSHLETETLDSLRRMLAVNLEGVFLGCKLAVPLMAASGGGSIVNLSSIAGLIGTPTLSAYGMSKGAVRQFSKTVAVDCGRKGLKIRCNSVHPGIIQTQMFDTLTAAPEARTAALARIPLGEFGTTTDIANGILFLLSDEARHITGAELVIDGGITAI